MTNPQVEFIPQQNGFLDKVRLDKVELTAEEYTALHKSITKQLEDLYNSRDRDLAIIKKIKDGTYKRTGNIDDEYGQRIIRAANYKSQQIETTRRLKSKIFGSDM